ncbi:MAG: hypothetical protein JW866_00085 [Ignavibacteriales bacterium]|nr:hypothetical protein [Ignavibacteriales bacterium]
MGKNKTIFLINLIIIKQCIQHYFNRTWNKTWIRKDEFHSSLDMDGTAMSYMSEKEREKYIHDLVKRRNIAHERDLLED